MDREGLSMDDLISRQALMKEFSDFVRASNNSDFARTPTWNDAVSLVKSMPSAQPTLYGYKIEHLAYIARVMQKEGVTAKYAVRTFDDMSRTLRMIIEEAQEKVEKSLNEMPWDDANLIKGTWDTKEMSTTQPDKIEVHLQEPYALMIKEFIVKETTYPMETKQETVGELIRCKDCAKREYCRTSTVWAIPPKDDWFCADAERREE